MLDNTTRLSDTTDASGGVTVCYIVDEAEARQSLGAMVGAGGRVAIDIETAPHIAHVEKLASLAKDLEVARGRHRALKKRKAPAEEIAALVAEGKQLAAAIKYAASAGLDPRRARIRLLQVYDGGDRVLVIDLDRTGVGILELLDGVSVIAHNMAFELSFIESAGVALGQLHCTAQACRLMLGEHATSLADGAEAYLDLKLDKTEQKGDWNALHLTRQQIEYAAIDAVVAWRLAEKILPRFDVQRAAYEIQMRAVPAAMRMKMRGFKLDVDAHARLISDLKQERIAAEQRYREACLESGHTALADRVPSTSAQKEELLNIILPSDALARWKRTAKSGKLSTARGELLRANQYPPIRVLAQLGKIDKLLTAFGPTLTALVSPVTGRIHAHYRVAATSTGRATCSGPNMQQTPRDARFRALFIPAHGHVLIVADYASMELRAAAFVSGDPVMTRAFEEGQDLHNITAARMLGIAPDQVSKEERRGAKNVNFGAIYGIGARALAATAWNNYQLVLDITEAKRWLDAFAQAYPVFARWRQENYARCSASRRILIGKDAAQGFGRVFPFSRLKPGNNGYTVSCNMNIQGSCADASMLALAYIDDRLFDADIDGGFVAWLHDEFIIEVREDQAERAAEILKQSMIDGFSETFPGAPLNGLVEPHVGATWGEAKVKSTITAGATQSFHPRPEPDFALAYAEPLRRDVGEDEARAPAFEHVAAACDGARPTEGVAMSHSAAQTAMGAFRAGETAEAHARVAPTFYEFFAGAGMARAGLGIEWECLLANDNDQRKGAAYAANWTADRLIVGDVGTLTVADLAGVAGLAWASPPCQDVSLAGERAGLDGARSGAFWPFMNLMRGLRAQARAPKIIVIENVTGLLTSHGGKDFDAICDALTDAGYRFGVIVIDAALFVPQSRKRVFIVAVDADAHIPAELVADGPMAPFHPPALVAACLRQKSQPIWFKLPTPPTQNSILADVLEDDLSVPWNTQAKTAKLMGMMDVNNLPKLDAAKRAGKRMVKGLYRRTRYQPHKVSRWEVRDDDIAGCLRVPSGGSSRQTIVIVEDTSVRSRLLSPREVARLMGLPEDYRLPANANAAYALTGDGVAVPVVRFLAEHILEPLLQASTPARRAVT
jgi:DNA (cytosine-5)-methyltransferase 1